MENLKNLTKDELIDLNLKLLTKLEILTEKIENLTSIYEKQVPKEVPEEVPVSKKVKDMVQEYEDNIIQPPLEFRDDYKPVPLPRTKKPVPLPRTKIEQVKKALKGYTKSFEISIINNKDPLTHPYRIKWYGTYMVQVWR